MTPQEHLPGLPVETKMRTPEELGARYKEIDAENRIFPFESLTIAEYMTAEQLTPYLKRDADPNAFDGWRPKPLTAEGVLKEMGEYMPFAWEKAAGERGISALRSVAKYRAWLWLLGRDDLLEEMDKREYNDYGKAILRWLCGVFAIPRPEGMPAP